MRGRELSYYPGSKRAKM